MAYLLGTDEAGYGPNLGPLVITATLWQAPDGVGCDDLYRRLADVVAAAPDRAAKGRNRRVVVADSKVLYTSGAGPGRLERGLWPAMAVLGHAPRTWRGVWNALAPESDDDLRTIPWYAGYDAAAPRCADPAELASLSAMLEEGLSAAGVRLLRVHSRAIFPRRFNNLVEQYGSKGAALSHQTLELAAGLVEPLGEGPISVVGDKHGGRDRYAALLAQHFPDGLVQVCGEGRSQSVYRFGPAGRRMEFCFRTKAESCLPVALASMASKYLRELAMQALNRFWGALVPGLKSTAGYPQDAGRFRATIAAAQAEQGIEDAMLWRAR